MASPSVVLLVAAVAMLGLATGGRAQLQNGFYKGKCGANDVEAIVQGVVKARFARDAPIVAYLLRMQFHECAVNGCDGGLLINGPGTEKTATPNLSVKGYDLIDFVKAELEKRCPGVVSCSDLQILATRDAVALAGGQSYPVRTGRRDSRRSKASDVVLPGAGYTSAETTGYFGKLGFSPLETVVLLGAHTVGVTHCSVIKNSRLYGYGGKPGATDPSLDSNDVSVYKKYVCSNTTASDGNALYLDDRWSALRVDNNIYKRWQGRHGVLSADQNLYSASSTRWMVDMLANTDQFKWRFPQALIKLSEVKVLTGQQGEIRKVCSRFN